MGRDYIQIRANGEREKLLDQAKAILDVDQDSEAIEAALRHLIESEENLEDVKREFTPEQAEAISTSELSLVMYPQVR